LQQLQAGGPQFQIVVPPNVRGGSTIKVQLPKLPPTPPHAVAVAASPQPSLAAAANPPSAAAYPRPSLGGTTSVHRNAPPATASFSTAALTGLPSGGTLWHGWILKKQPNFPFSWQKR
jgi:hypothetical protein